MKPARLNVFQRLARGWDITHPYNAAQAIRLPASTPLEEANAAWRRLIVECGFGAVSVRRGRYSFAPAQDFPDVARLDPTEPLATHFSRELNRPFPSGSLPFRPFALQEADGVWLGVCYQHWLADSVAIRWLMREWTEAILHRKPDRLIALLQGAWNDLPNGRRAAWPWWQAACARPPRWMAYRRVRKIHTMGPLDYETRVRLRRAPDGLVEPLLRFARRHDVKLTDVFLAAMAEACAALVPAQRRPGREDLSVGAILDLRPPGLPPSKSFGLRLGFRDVVLKPRDFRNFQHVLRSVAAQSRQARKVGVGAASVLSFAWAETLERFTPRWAVYDLYRKFLPLAGGLSNVDLDRDWPERRPPPDWLDCVRVSPTGPMTPTALAVTTMRGQTHLALTYRPALMNDWSAAELLGMFTDRLESLATQFR